jgi:RimJ/RimL family protein N-acetyltransferase
MRVAMHRQLMRVVTHAPQVLQQLERNLLRNVVLLKHITAFPDDTNAYLVESIGGVVPSPSHRSLGLGSRVVQAALAELARRGLLARYQVGEDNQPSIGVARSIGMTQLPHLTHYVHFW